MATVLDPATLVGKNVVLLIRSAEGMEEMRLAGKVTEYDRIGGVVRLTQSHVRFGKERWTRTPRVGNRPVLVRNILLADVKS